MKQLILGIPKGNKRPACMYCFICGVEIFETVIEPMDTGELYEWFMCKDRECENKLKN